MALPSPDEVKTWGGKVIVDRSGLPIGTVTQVYTDDDTGLPEWATIRLGEATIFLPLLGAVEQDGQVRVTVRRDDVAKAPAVLDRDHISPDEEVRLYRYYGIPYTPRPSGNVLPTGEGPHRGPGAAAAVERFATARPVRVALAALAGAAAAPRPPSRCSACAADAHAGRPGPRRSSTGAAFNTPAAREAKAAGQGGTAGGGSRVSRGRDRSGPGRPLGDVEAMTAADRSLVRLRGSRTTGGRATGRRRPRALRTLRGCS